MAARTISIRVENVESFEAVMITATQAGIKAQRRAIKEMGRAARTTATRELSRKLAVPGKVIRNRIQVFLNRARRAAPITGGRLWGGLKKQLVHGEHPRVGTAIEKAQPQGWRVDNFWKAPRTKSGWYKRTGRSRYPIKEQFFSIPEDDLGDSLQRGVRNAFATRYPRRLRQLYLLELRKGKTKTPRRARR